MRTRALLHVLVGLLFAASACARARPTFVLAPKAELAQVQAVALMPVDVPDFPHAAAAKAEFDMLLRAELQRLGFRLIPGAEVEQLQAHVRASEPGHLYDPNTGELNGERQARIEEKFRELARDSLRVDAIVAPVYVVRRAKLSDGVADWDGVSQRTEKLGTSILRAMGGMKMAGTMPALSLRVTMSHVNGATLFENFGGIEVLARTNWLGSSAAVADTSLLRNRERNAKAVTAAFKPLREAILGPGK